MVAKAETIIPQVVSDTNAVLSALLFKSGRVSWLVPFSVEGFSACRIVTPEQFRHLLTSNFER